MGQVGTAFSTERALICETPITVRFRPIQPDDAAFLYEVYASTRLDEFK
jgi:hypothetical protein